MDTARMTALGQLLADVANEAYAQWWNDEMGEIQQIPDLITDALLASPEVAEILDWAAVWAHEFGPPDLSHEVRALLADWRANR